MEAVMDPLEPMSTSEEQQYDAGYDDEERYYETRYANLPDGPELAIVDEYDLPF